MGMDVFGKKPKNEIGEGFRNNVWWWRPLANYCIKLAPELTSKCKYWHSNDGTGLNSRDSIKLAKILQQEIDNGNCQKYEDAYEHDLASEPDKVCDLCEGTGIRSDMVGIQNGMTTKVIDEPGHPRHGQIGWCNGCAGKGYTRPWSNSYPFSVENVQEFVEFLKNCGGFKIY